ncbi:TSG101 [Lepeophtheirus salmonis]|uniref:TSG101 n=2 Tax=Lepeophtheirus salmonis TaxID=72036 RepID=D3PJH7_LEPSM|nr:Tumor susceptibility gene 101 protein [Lepeophtheirus salmonis]CAB4068694.1 TSG101 [Lepeophtheirus salmonis]CAF3014059.1 TSG101 [Lepeophtheirus salmonis]
MSSVIIQNLISSVSYRNPRQTKSDIMGALNNYRSLNARTDYFSFNDGVRKKLLVLGGTIPVNYRGGSYNIPVSFWLLDTHPVNAPICYVSPTANMSIKISRNVDSSGKIYLPYLHEWNKNRSDLLSLIQICIAVFSEQSPVYTKSVTTPYLEPTRFPAISSSVTSQHLKTSLLTAVQDKLRKALREEFEIKGCELQSLRKMRDDLNAGKVQIDGAIAESKQRSNVLDENIESLKKKLEELENANSKLEKSQNNDLDDAVVGTAPLYNQLFTTFAKEASIDDTIYYLGEGLRRGVIDCDSFLKNVRRLSRQQFELRSLMIKCREKAGLRI